MQESVVAVATNTFDPEVYVFCVRAYHTVTKIFLVI